MTSSEAETDFQRSRRETSPLVHQGNGAGALSQTTATEPSNRFPDCVFVKLHCAPVATESAAATVIITTGTRSSLDDPIELQLTIRFGTQEIKVPGGQVWFGLRRGELKLKIENGRIPIETTGLSALFKTFVPKEIQKRGGSEQEGSLTIAVASGFGTKAKTVSETTTKVMIEESQVSTRGTEEEPVWVFESKISDTPLKGQLSEASLGTVEVAVQPCKIQATFEVRGQRDICLTEAEGLWAKDLGRNKRAVLEREFFLRFIAPRLQPFLSQIEVQL